MSLNIWEKAVIPNCIRNTIVGGVLNCRAMYPNGTTKSISTPLVNWNVRIFPVAFIALFKGFDRQSTIAFISIILRKIAV